MRDLTAQVTSGLLHFPEVTIQALGEDEITLESVLRGKFTSGKSGLACLACGPQLEVVNSVTGARLSAYRFNGVSDQPPVILAVREFSWQKKTGLLIGLEEAEGSVLCLYDLGVSRVVKAVILPGRVTNIEPIVNRGGASTGTQHLHPGLRWFFGVAAVATDIGQILLLDLCLDDLCSQNEVEASDLEVLTGVPAEVPQLRENVLQEGRHLCFQLTSPSGTPVSTLSFISRTNHLAVGSSDGFLALWNMKSLKREYYTQLEGGRVPVYAVTFQEPENDPRNCCYLWAVQSAQDREGDVLSLHLLQLAFGDRKCLASGQILYEGLEYCEERYTLDLTCGTFPLRGQTTNTKLLGCQTIEKFRSHSDREESMHEVLSPDTSVSVFTWQVNVYGQGKPSIYLGLFDINRWYHAQMPDSLRSGEYLHNCSYFALWSLDSVVSKTSPHYILDILVHERSLSRGVPPLYPPPEQFFNPSTYSFDATCLLNSGVVHITCTGFQKETLTFLRKSGPSLNEVIPDGYNRCLVAGLLSPRLTDMQPSTLSQEEQLEAILSAAIHTNSLGLLTGSIRRWIANEQPNSAANLRLVLEWTWNKMIVTKEEFDRLCAPLFDGSCHFVDPQITQCVQQCYVLFGNLSTVLGCFATEAQEVTNRGLMDLHSKHVVSRLICQYAQMVLWFCHSGLLPEGLDDAVQLSSLRYNYSVIQNYYTSRRQSCEHLSRGKWNPDCLMIDGLVSQLGGRIENLWKRDEGGTGRYPPTSLHALLDIYLLDNVSETIKHAITIYLLLDIIYSFPDKTETSVASFPGAFAISWGQVKLIQGFWLLDHSDYESALDILFHPTTAKPMTWQHSRILQAFMCQGEHKHALRYIQTLKPPVASSEDVLLHLTVLLFNRCMVEAWTLLRLHSHSLNVEELLKHTYEVCQEKGLMEDLLKLPFTDIEQECLVKFLQSSANAQNHEFLLVHHLQRANYIPALKLNQTLKMNLKNDRDPCLRERSVARNSMLDQYGKVLPRVQRELATERAKPYRLPSASVFRQVTKPKPLSAVPKPAARATVLSRSTFINSVLTKIGEVWAGNDPKTSSSPSISCHMDVPSPAVRALPDAELSQAFVGTPISKAPHISRLLDLVRPVPQASQYLSFVQPSPTAGFSHLSPVSNLLPLNELKGSPQNTSGASEFNLLETPLVVKKAKTLAMSVASTGFAEFTPQSILRSGLRTTPLASPSLSSGRSFTPPLRLKETKISFMEEGSAIKWTTEVASRSKTGAFITTPFAKDALQAETEWLMCKDKPISFSLGGPETDHPEIAIMSLDTPSQALEKLDMSKESSMTSTRSDLTSLEYQDAPSPGESQDTVLRASKQEGSSAEIITNLTEPVEMEDDKDEPESQVTSPHRDKQTGTLEVTETKDHIPEGTILELPEQSSPVQGLDTSCAPSVHEGKVFLPESVVPVLDEGLEGSVENFISASTADNNKSLVDTLTDSGDSDPIAFESPIISEHTLDQEIALNLKEVNEMDTDVQKQNLSAEKPPISDGPSDAHEIHVTESEKVEAQDLGEETRNLSHNELYPSGTLKFRYNFDTIEHQFHDLPDNKDSAESDAAEGDGELFVAQSNFTLILEGEEGEVETDDFTASNILVKATDTATEEEFVHLGEDDNHGHIANLPSLIKSDQESQKGETLPYVPEPIKTAIAENLLGVIKDTRSKDATSETVEQSIHENMPLISHKVTPSTSLIKTPLKTMEETSMVTKNVSQVEDTVASRTRMRGRRVQSLNIPSQQEEPAASPAASVPGLSVTKKSRRTKNTSHASENVSPDDVKGLAQSQRIPQTPVTPKRGRRKRNTDQDTSESSDPARQEPHLPAGKELRHLESSQLLEPATEETSFNKEITLTSASKKTPKRVKKSVANQEGVEMLNDPKINTVASPNRSIRKLRSARLTASEDKEFKQESKSSDQHLAIEGSRKVKEKDVSISDAMDHSKFESSQLTTQAEFDIPATPRKRGRPRKIEPSAGPGSKAFEGEGSPPKKKALISQRRSARNAPARSENTDMGKPALEVSVLLPNEELAPVASSKKSTTKSNRKQSQKRSLHTVSEERLAKEVASKESACQEGLLAASVLTDSSRSTRTRSNRGILLPDLSEPASEPLLFSSVSKVPKKEKAKKIEASTQLKELVSDLSSPFVFSPPTLRTRQKNSSDMSKLIDKSEDHPKLTETVEKQEVKRLKTPKTKQARRQVEEEGSPWTTPPVEIKLISPLASPVEGVKRERRRTTEGVGRVLGRTRKKPSPFPKQILRRKML
ncbi:PREDICTED: protein ELYS [Elephantulus edwardii]|uniref:protein ELYS n=1 Tax=Elephantulus edwardii TaxID=28737 RepID=UPI0003F06DA8|nr:PREDICTED: protein ELYS [Elephantulus edwardii]